MGLSTELTEPRLSPRRGAALPAALFGLVTVSLLAAAMFAASSMQAAATRNRESSARALQLAENGMAHAVTVVRDSLRGWPFTRLLRGSDDTPNTADDGLLTGYALSSGIDIPAAGRSFGDGSYKVEITDDVDGDGNLKNDANYRVKMSCTATTSDGARAVLDVVLGVTVLPAIAANGNLSIGGPSKVLGVCGSIHANQNLTVVTGSQVPTISGTATASGTVSGTAKDTLGAAKTPAGSKPQVTIPTMTYAQFCGTPGTNATVNKTDVDYWLTSSGHFYTKGNPVPQGPATTSLKIFGWWRSSIISPITWSVAHLAKPGKYCVEGNVEISGNSGSSTAPIAVSIIATGSVSITGTPFMVPAKSDSVLVVSGGDLYLAGNASGANESFEGLLYANSQCSLSGTPSLAGQLLCKDNPTGTGNKEYTATNTITGTPTLTYGCGGLLSRRRVFSWLQRVE